MFHSDLGINALYFPLSVLDWFTLKSQNIPKVRQKTGILSKRPESDGSDVPLRSPPSQRQHITHTIDSNEMRDFSGGVDGGLTNLCISTYWKTQ